MSEEKSLAVASVAASAGMVPAPVMPPAATALPPLQLSGVLPGDQQLPPASMTPRSIFARATSTSHVTPGVTPGRLPPIQLPAGAPLADLPPASLTPRGLPVSNLPPVRIPALDSHRNELPPAHLTPRGAAVHASSARLPPIQLPPANDPHFELPPAHLTPRVTAVQSATPSLPPLEVLSALRSSSSVSSIVSPFAANSPFAAPSAPSGALSSHGADASGAPAIPQHHVSALSSQAPALSSPAALTSVSAIVDSPSLPLPQPSRHSQLPSTSHEAATPAVQVLESSAGRASEAGSVQPPAVERLPNASSLAPSACFVSAAASADLGRSSSPGTSSPLRLRPRLDLDTVAQAREIMQGGEAEKEGSLLMASGWTADAEGKRLHFRLRDDVLSVYLDPPPAGQYPTPLTSFDMRTALIRRRDPLPRWGLELTVPEAQVSYLLRAENEDEYLGWAVALSSVQTLLTNRAQVEMVLVRHMTGPSQSGARAEGSRVYTIRQAVPSDEITPAMRASAAGVPPVPASSSAAAQSAAVPLAPSHAAGSRSSWDPRDDDEEPAAPPRMVEVQVEVSPGNAPALDIPLEQCQRSAPLYVHKGTLTRAWRKRWGTLRDNTLLISKTEKEKAELVIDVCFCSAKLPPKPVGSKKKERDYIFLVVTRAKTYEFSCEDSASLLAWITCIQNAQQRLMGARLQYSLASASACGATSTPQQQAEVASREAALSLLKLPGNRKCADCGAKDPIWASINLGVVICIACSGAHRKLGTHISQVRSLTLDVLEPAALETLRSLGNDNVNRRFAARVTPEVQITPKDSMERREAFIRAKYERKLYAA